MSTPAVISDERLGKPSASEMDRIMACAGYLGLKRMAESQRVIPDGKGDSAAAEKGTLLHDANEAGDTTDLKYSEEEQVKIIRHREEEITRQWCADLDIPFDQIKIEREVRLWFLDTFSAKIDTLVTYGYFGLVIDAKSGRLPVPPPVRNWQLRTCAAVARHNRHLTHVRVAIANVWGALMPPCDYPLDELQTITKMIVARLAHVQADNDLETTPGDHCRYCHAIHICPSQRDQMGVAIGQRTLNWDLVKPEQKKPLWLAADMAEKAAKAIKEQIKADLAAGVECPGLIKKPDGMTRKITDTQAAVMRVTQNVLERNGVNNRDPLEALIETNKLLSYASISIDGITTYFRDRTGASQSEADNYFRSHFSDIIEQKPRSGSVSVKEEK